MINGAMISGTGDRFCWGKPKWWDIHKYMALLVSYLNMVQERSLCCFAPRMLCRPSLAWLQEDRSLPSSDRKCCGLPLWRAVASGGRQRPGMKCVDYDVVVGVVGVVGAAVCCWLLQKKWFPSTWKKLSSTSRARARRSQSARVSIAKFKKDPTEKFKKDPTDKTKFWIHKKNNSTDGKRNSAL